MVAVVGVRTTRAGNQVPPSLRRGIGVWTLHAAAQPHQARRSLLSLRSRLRAREDLVELDAMSRYAADLRAYARSRRLQRYAPACLPCQGAEVSNAE